MPEGPELHLAAKFITTIGKRTLFGGRVIKSEVSTKNPDVKWDKKVYRVKAESRGKELKVILMKGKEEEEEGKKKEEEGKGGETLSILFRFGMSGSFKYTKVTELHKHAHLQFYTISEQVPMVLSFVDYRRFGRWEIEGDWGSDRGPDPMFEYQAFRSNVLDNLKYAAFNRPICEAMLNQKFFNGIGNYLRAEILYRCSVPPFDEAREVLSELHPVSEWYEEQVKQEDVKKCIVKQEEVKKECIGKQEVFSKWFQNEVKEEDETEERKVKQEEVSEWIVKEDVKETEVKPDLLDLCHILPKEVINLSGGGKGYNVDPDANEEEYAAFRAWLQCYYQDGMKNIVDHNKRTMWFKGEPGRLKPKDASSRNKVERKKKTQKKQENKKKAKEQTLDSDNEETKTKTKTRETRPKKTSATVETKKTKPKKTTSKNDPIGKAKKTPRKNQVKVKEEETDAPLKLKPSKARRKCEEVNSVPRRKSARLTQQH